MLIQARNRFVNSDQVVSFEVVKKISYTDKTTPTYSLNLSLTGDNCNTLISGIKTEQEAEALLLLFIDAFSGCDEKVLYLNQWVPMAENS
mgnify:CR=1 FL=1